MAVRFLSFLLRCSERPQSEAANAESDLLFFPTLLSMDQPSFCAQGYDETEELLLPSLRDWNGGGSLAWAVVIQRSLAPPHLFLLLD